jgi:hypothetical protein
VYAAQALQAANALTDTFQWGDFEAPGIAHHDRFDGAMATEQKADLTFDFARELGEIARYLLRDDAFRRETTAIQMFETAKLAWL